MAALCSVRLMTAFLVLPVTSEQALQGGMRMATAVLLSCVIAWGMPLGQLKNLAAPELALLVLKEALIGVWLGYAAAMIFWIAESAGTLIDNLAGYSNIQQNNAATEQQSTPLGGLFVQLAIALFMIMGGFLAFLGVCYDTFRWWPLFAWLPAPDRLAESFFLNQTDAIMSQMFKLASPCLLTLVLIDLGVGLVGKTAGKLEPQSLAAPIKAGIALVVMALSLVVFVEQLKPELALQSLAARIRLLHAR